MADNVYYRPKLWWQVAFNAEPNSGDVPIWSNLTSMFRRLTQPLTRGRPWELVQGVGVMSGIQWRDPNEYLNPANTSSPYWPNVEPYREVIGQAMWPNPLNGLGADVNLLNSGRWKPNDDVAPDPSFESYANGAALPGWLTAVGASVPTVTTTDPQQGTKSLTYTVAATTTRQGVSWEVDCVPGEQVTTSAYVRQSSASTQRLSVIDQTLAWDAFGTASASGWGDADGGGTWANDGGVAGDYTVAGGVGLISATATNADRVSTLDVGNIDAVVRGLLVDVATPAGAGSQQGFVGRWTDASNYYLGVVTIDTSGFISASIRKRVAGALTTISTVVTALRTGAGVMCVFSVDGPNLKLKLWAEDAVEPAAWTLETTDTAITTGTKYGCMARRDTSETSPTVFSFDNLYIVGSVSSSTTTTTGSYVRLSVTFTATQPKHTVQLVTIGTAVAGTVNVDALQHELGASASTFTTAGPVIYPLTRLYVKSWGREYEDVGFSGIATTPLVDAEAALAATKIRSDYATAVLDLQPAYYWPLSGGVGTSQALEISGNAGPFLSRFDSKYGPGFPPEFGVAIDIPGNAGASGVRFTPAVPGATEGPDSILSLGRTPTTPGILFPRDYGTTTWAASIACWAQINATDTQTQNVVFTFGASSPASTVPLAIVATSFDALGVVDFSVVSQASIGPAGSVSAATFDYDQGPHLVVATITQTNGGDTTVSIYVDGVFGDDTTVTTASLGGIYSAESTILNVGGNSLGGLHVDGVVSHVALWERALTAAEILTLWTAGGLGNTGELTGTRLARHLASGRYTGATRISPGSTTLQPPSWSGSIDLLTDAQNITVAEDGTLWVAPDGALVMEGRQDRWLRLTSTGTFGEAETPYEDGIGFDNDPSYVTPDVQVSRVNGDTAVGGTVAAINAATRKYFGRSYTESSDYEDDVQAQSKADWVFATHRAPLQRVAALALNPAANTALWPVALSAEIGQRKTVIRRAKAGNAGAGLTMSNEYFIEQISHAEIDMDSGRWTMAFQLSPIGLASAGNGVTFQPWILGDSTYGVLNSTTVLGW